MGYVPLYTQQGGCTCNIFREWRSYYCAVVHPAWIPQWAGLGDRREEGVLVPDLVLVPVCSKLPQIIDSVPKFCSCVNSNGPGFAFNQPFV